jgi:hypothetical protein
MLGGGDCYVYSSWYAISAAWQADDMKIVSVTRKRRRRKRNDDMQGVSVTRELQRYGERTESIWDDLLSSPGCKCFQPRKEPTVNGNLVAGIDDDKVGSIALIVILDTRMDMRVSVELMLTLRLVNKAWRRAMNIS